MCNFSKIILTPLIVTLSLIFASCSDGGDGGDSRTLVTRYGYNLTANENYYRVMEYRAYYEGNYVYDVHDYIVHWFLKTSSKYKNKSGSELCEIVKNRSATPNSKNQSVVEGDKTHTINSSQSDGTIKVVTMKISDGTMYESWVYK